MAKITIKEIRFNTRVTQKEIPFFRSCLCSMADFDSNTLMHNHKGDCLRYGYPLVQYRSIGNKGVVFAINEGLAEVAPLENITDMPVDIGSQRRTLKLESSHMQISDLCFTATPLLYKIDNWLPFSSDNERLFVKLDSLLDRIAFLQRMLTANIISMAKGFGIHLDEEIKVSVKDLFESKRLLYKGVPFISFSLSFYANLALPDKIALGKHVSHGFGVVSVVGNDIS
ncbi:MAG: hypothetical protein J5875_04195 [Paludibacteraceae bacterium]|nr:hypothetical protein [Paludibacteraceae bacterium]